MKKILLSVFFCFLSTSLVNAEEELTALSKKVASLKSGMPKTEVIALLGSATWASIPGDKGKFPIPSKDLGLVLRWKNLPCSPVVVQFNHSYEVTGWDEGRAICGEDMVKAMKIEPGDEYSCDKEDRSKFCN